MVTIAPIENLVPQRLKMSYAEYLEFAGDSQIVEWVDGEVFTYMPPVSNHQRIVIFLSEFFNSFIQFFDLGELLIAPLEVKLWPGGPSREPDIIFIRRENLSRITEQKVEGAPDLVVEVISPGSVSIDRVAKFSEYERAGVGEYWIIDPRLHQRQADFYILGEDGLYHDRSVDEVGIYHSVIIPDFWLNLTWLWQEPLPNPQLALAELMMSLDALPGETRAAYRTLYTILTQSKR
ncbi:MAG: Uma2 family endonuclease [Anaerolineae bacterium]